MRTKATLSLVGGGLVSAAMLYLALHNVPLHELAVYIRSMDLFWLLPTAAIVLATFVLRTARWRIILHGVSRLSFWQAFHPLMIGFMMNCILPGRVGELARPVLLKRQHRVPLTAGLATVAVERIFDIFCLLVLFTAVFSTIANQPGTQVTFGGRTLDHHTLNLIAGGLIRAGTVALGMMLLLVMPWSRDRIKAAIKSLAQRKWLSGRSLHARLALRAIEAVHDAVENVSAGFALVRYPKRLAACLLLSAAIWGLTLASYLVLARAFPGVHLSAWAWTTVMVVVCFFIALPSVPGFWGLWEAGGVFALSLFGVGAKEAAGMTLVNHAVQMLPVILVGFISASLISVNILRLTDKNKQLAAAM